MELGLPQSSKTAKEGLVPSYLHKEKKFATQEDFTLIIKRQQNQMAEC